MARTLATLHTIIPSDVDLQSYGLPTRYNARQVSRWSKQYQQSVFPGESPMQEMIELSTALASRIPQQRDADPSIVRVCHGDYRLDNLVFDPGRHDAVIAVLDWELSTLGDPLADLAYSCMPYRLLQSPQTSLFDPGDSVGHPQHDTTNAPNGIPDSITLPSPLPPGIPTEEQYIQLYCQVRNIPYPLQADWPFYLALSLYRLASILAGVGARAKQGNASSRIAAQMGSDNVVRHFARTALQILKGEQCHVVQGRVNHAPLQGTPSEPYATPMQSILLKQSPESGGASGASAVQLGLGPSERVKPLLAKLDVFMKQHIHPAEAVLHAHAVSDQRWSVHPLQESLKKKAKEQGLWNLWIPEDMAKAIESLLHDELSSDEKERSLLLGPGLTNLEYAHCAEIMGHSVWAPEAFNCSAPDTGNMEVLARYGSKQQQQMWLLPLLHGDIRSCFAMTEPAVASSDATNIQSSITPIGSPSGTTGSIIADKSEAQYYAVNGRKWWISGATDPRCSIAIFMGKTDRDPRAMVRDDEATAKNVLHHHRQQSMILVPMNSPGVNVIRPLPVFGFDDAPHGHAEILFDSVKVPKENLILGEGRGFEIAQGRLGPGRLHHCMRLIGMGERAISLMVHRATARMAFGKKLAQHQSIRLDIAKSRAELDSARLMVLNAAHALDKVGNKKARTQIAAAKAITPSTVVAIVERAIQMHGGAGVSDVTPLAGMYAGARTLRLADGPDVVHWETIAKMELKKAVTAADDDDTSGLGMTIPRAKL